MTESDAHPNPEDPMDLSIVVACYNEASHLKKSVQEIVATLRDTSYRYEILFIDDCSQDDTRDVIDEIIASTPGVAMRRIFHEKNVGRGGTVSEGMLATRGRVRGFLDIDLEVHARYIPSCVRAIQEGADVAVGWRIYKLSLSAFHRYILSRGYIHLVHWMYGVTLNDTESGYKFFSEETCRSLLPEVKDRGWFWDTEVMLRAAKAGRKIVEIPCLFIRRRDKKSTVRVLRDSWEYFKRLIAFRAQVGLPGREARGELRPGAQSHAFQHDETYWWYRGRLKVVDEMVQRWQPGRQRILDVGCGTGLVLEHFSRSHAVVGLDSSDEALALAGRRARGLVRGRAETMPFRDATFDLVLLLDVLEHMKEEDQGLQQVARILRPGGSVLITVPAHAILWGRIDEVGGHYRRYSGAALCHAIEASGLRTEWITYYNTLLFPLGVFFRLIEHRVMKDRGEEAFLPSLPGPINDLFFRIFAMERFIVPRLRLPMGLSLLAWARKPAETVF